MTDAAAEALTGPTKPRKRLLILALVLSVGGAAAGYFGVASGVIPLGVSGGRMSVASDLPDVEFIEIDPVMITLTGGQRIQQLRFRAQLEVPAAARPEVEMLLPRVTDVLNGYLRALRVQDLRDPLALTRLRGHMLRRVQVVVGRERVRDLLIMEFVLN